MQIHIEKFKIIIVSDKISSLFAKLVGFDGNYGRRKAMGFAIFPCFIILRNLTHPMTRNWINHESIHLKQNFESFGIFYLLSIIEYIYYRIFKKYSHLEAYRMEAVEQEAYFNQNNSNYLSERPTFATIKYFKNKKHFFLDENHQVVIDS